MYLRRIRLSKRLYPVFAISVFHRLSMRYCDICRYFLLYITVFGDIFCGIAVFGTPQCPPLEGVFGHTSCEILKQRFFFFKVVFHRFFFRTLTVPLLEEDFVVQGRNIMILERLYRLSLPLGKPSIYN